MAFPFAPKPDRNPTDPEQVEPEMTDIERIASDKVLQHRASTLADHGFTPQQARVLALDRTVDIRWVINSLVKKGCPVDVAFDIASS